MRKSDDLDARFERIKFGLTNRSFNKMRRLLVLKLDHIGDFIIGLPALQMLRTCFPDAEITLICGPWNIALAKRLKIADKFISSEFFSQNSLSDLDHEDLRKRRSEAIAKLRDLNLGPFDLAVDLRRDEDTRPLLKLFDASVRAGMGDLATYSYLDVAMPVTHLGIHEGASSMHLDAADMDERSEHRIDETGLYLSASRALVRLRVMTDAFWAPAEDGVPDDRKLGVALWQVFVRLRKSGSINLEMSAPFELARDDIEAGPGWLAWEPWGRWSGLEESYLDLSFQCDDAEVEVLVRLQGHTSLRYPEALVQIWAGSNSVEHRFKVGDEPATLRLPCRAELGIPTARSAPMLLRAGRYRGKVRLHVPSAGVWESMILRVKTGYTDSILAKLVLPNKMNTEGLVDFPFELELIDASEPVLIEISADQSQFEQGLAIHSIDMECVQARSPLMPIAHMEQQLLDLATLIASRHATRLSRPDPGQSNMLLTTSRSDSTARRAIRELGKMRGRSWFRKRGPRRLIGIGLGANKETKLWPEAHWLSLLHRLLEHEDVTLVFVGGPADKGKTEDILKALDMGTRAVDLCGCCKIEDLGELLAQLDGYIGLDTGTTHFAGRIGIRTLAIFGAAHDPYEWGVVGVRSGWAVDDIACRSCSLSEARQCAIGVACMSNLTPERVWPFVEEHVLG